MRRKHKKRANIRGWQETPVDSRSRNMNQFATQVEEEVIRVDGMPQTKKRERFQHLSSVSLTSMIQTIQQPTDTKREEEEEEEEEGEIEGGEELGFFLDSEPATIIESTPLPELPKLADLSSIPIQSKKQYEKQYKRIIQDDSVYIDREEDDDDQSSISSSEDVEGLEALSHWMNQDIVSFGHPMSTNNTKELDDYDMLERVTLGDIFESEEDDDDVDDSEEEEDIMDEPFLNEDLLGEHVPEFMRNSYKQVIRESKKRMKKLQQNNKKPMQLQRETIKNNQRLKSNVLEKILREFIRKEGVSSYSFTNLTNHGRANVVPKLAQLFNLKLSLIGGNPKNVLLTKTKDTSIPKAFKKHRENRKQMTKSPIATKPTKKRKRNESFYEEESGGIVGGEATPISSSNVGHRMLAAMGWKQGEAIGSNENGIKEPIQVTIRPKNRGLGA